MSSDYPSFQMYSVNLTYEIVNCQYTNNLNQDPFKTQSGNQDISSFEKSSSLSNIHRCDKMKKTGKPCLPLK